MVKSGLSARPNVGPMHSMFVAAGQAGYMTTASGKELVVAFYALNGTYAKFEEGIDAFPATAKVLTAIQKAE